MNKYIADSIKRLYPQFMGFRFWIDKNYHNMLLGQGCTDGEFYGHIYEFNFNQITGELITCIR